MPSTSNQNFKHPELYIKREDEYDLQAIANSNRQFEYGTQDLAEGFIDGVQFVNDSMVYVLGYEHIDNKWVVYLFDESDDAVLAHPPSRIING